MRRGSARAEPLRCGTLIVAIALAAGACSGKVESDGPAEEGPPAMDDQTPSADLTPSDLFAGGPPSDTPLGELTSEDLQLLCEEQLERLALDIGTEQRFCQILGVSLSLGTTASELREDCQRRVDECLQKGGGQLDGFVAARHDTCQEDPLRVPHFDGYGECEQPLSRLETCLAEDVVATARAADSSCAELTPVLREELVGSGAECQSLLSDCD